MFSETYSYTLWSLTGKRYLVKPAYMGTCIIIPGHWYGQENQEG